MTDNSKPPAKGGRPKGSKNRRSLEVTPALVDRFIGHYVEHLGNFSAAARELLTPAERKRLGRGVPSVYRALKRLQHDDPIFAARINEADRQILELVEGEILRRGMGWEEYSVSSGRVIKDPETGKPLKVTKYDSKLLLATARKLNPDWNEKTVHEVHHYDERKRWSITTEEIHLLTPCQRENLLDIIDALEAIRRDRDGLGKPTVIDITPESEEPALIGYDKSGGAMELSP